MNERNPSILYCDGAVAVCHKPAGILSEGEGEDCLPTLLSRVLAERGEINTTLYPVHRLDRETEGVMVLARTKKAAAALSQAIVDNALKKEYLAVICGSAEPPEGALADLLFYDRTKGKTFVVTRERKGVKEARLTYETVATHAPHSLLRIRLQTGRTHQIRAQFASRKCPLRGDRKYGAPKEDCPLMLCACRLAFPHPKTGKFMEFTTTPQAPMWQEWGL